MLSRRLERFCQRVLSDIEGLVRDSTKTSHERYLTIYRLIRLRNSELAAIFDDETHSTAEVRELIIGYSIAGRLLLVSFTERPGNMLRLISARVATKKERQDYEDNLNP